MHYRTLGRTSLRISALGFGCGSVGGLLVRGSPKDIVDTVALAIEAGITYFDTARSYGNGVSETNLGTALHKLRANVVVGTKVALQPRELVDIERSVIASVEGSLRRLGRDYVDLIQLHNRITSRAQPARGWLSTEQVGIALAAFEKLRQQGKVGHYGINGLGDTQAIHAAIAAGLADTTQTVYNLLNPSAGQPVPDDFPFQDYGCLIDGAVNQGMGTIAIRVLAGGALSGTLTRQPNAAPSVGPIGTGESYGQDVALAQRLGILVDEGLVQNTVEAAIRFVIGNPKISTALVGFSNGTQLQQAVTYATRGPLPAAALPVLQGVWSDIWTNHTTRIAGEESI